MNIRSKLEAMRLRTFTLAGLVTDVRELVEERGVIAQSKLLVRELLSREIEFGNVVEARVFIKRLMVELYEANFVINPIEVGEVIDACWSYTRLFVGDAKWSFLFSLDEKVEVGKVEERVVTKQDQVRQMYKELVIDGGCCTREFGKRLVSELGMSKAGALTYIHNAKKYYGGV